MASVSLGDVTFGLGADTKGLNKSITVLNNFGRIYHDLGYDEEAQRYFAQALEIHHNLGKEI